MAIYVKYTNNMRPEEIRIDVGSTDSAINIVQKLIDDKFIDIKDFSWAYLRYNVKHLPDPDVNSSKHYPLSIRGSDIELNISGISAGYGGTGPTGTMKLLQMFGFKYTAEQEQIITEATYNPDGSRVEDITLHFDRYEK